MTAAAARLPRWWWGAALYAAIGGVCGVHAQTAQPQTGERLRDAEFGVSTRQFGLQRSVRMYQWQRSGEQYQRIWSERLIDSRTYPADRRNPEAMPISTRYWVAQRVRIDGKPVDAEVLKRLGQWRDFRPDFSALPGNLSATFQPEGDGLGSAENPLAPQVGDLRIGWREMTLPALDGRIVLQDGRWVPAAQAGTLTQPPAASAMDAELQTPSQPPMREFLRRYGWVAIAAMALLVLLLALFRRRR